MVTQSKDGPRTSETLRSAVFHRCYCLHEGIILTNGAQWIVHASRSWVFQVFATEKSLFDSGTNRDIGEVFGFGEIEVDSRRYTLQNGDEVLADMETNE